MPPKAPKKLKEEKEAEERFKKRIISKVSQYPCLYDKENGYYWDTKAKSDIWATITKETGCTSIEIAAKWKSLRDAYVREKRLKENESLSGSAASKRKPFSFFEQLSFLQAYVRKRESISTVDFEDTESDASTQKGNEEEDNNDIFFYKSLDNEIILANESLDLSQSPDCQTSFKMWDVLNEAKNLAILSPKRDKTQTQEKRSKAKKDIDMALEISRVVTSIESQLSQSDRPEMMLGHSIGKALSEIKNPLIKNKWKRDFRNLLSEMEDAMVSSEVNENDHQYI
ncbi:unnamed protein product [Brassicogethes aeneus]|uniref:MADF domain-containing protein n=1 Tax=Brassicogethes aeneus TaxID=1431903 RepID=A0A9P0BJ86_BRAAE|nr:unnamed protein product [Brassicogethes aeneus]